jgi:outer membrane receptor for ferrienterochelin and colicins
LTSGLKVSTSFAGSFLDIDDKIDMALIRINPSTLIREFQYINISKYKMWNFSTMNQFKKGNWNLNFGAALVGISQKIENQIFASNEKFLYSFNINSNISYFVPKWQTTFSAYYKYNGKTQQFVEGNSEYIISTIDASNWLDASIRKSFFKNQLEATIGARNILDITNINQTRANDGAAHGTSSNIMLAYGRSYFFKLTYNLNF